MPFGGRSPASAAIIRPGVELCHQVGLCQVVPLASGNLQQVVVQNPSSYQFERTMTRMEAAELSTCNWDQVCLGDKFLLIWHEAQRSTCIWPFLCWKCRLPKLQTSHRELSVLMSSDNVHRAVYTHMGRHKTCLCQ